MILKHFGGSWFMTFEAFSKIFEHFGAYWFMTFEAIQVLVHDF
jgi:hypothetical protein